MRVLIAEDDPELLAQLSSALREEGYAVDAAADGREAEYVATTMPIDLAVIDLGLPEQDGLSVIRKFRRAGFGYPVLILTARDSWEDKVEGLEAGADDYLAKPFHVEELLARLRALLRRAGGFSSAVLEFGRLSIDTRSQSVQVDGSGVALTAYEYRLLAYLANQGGAVISKADLLDHLYEEDTDRDPNVLEVFVRRLRSKLDPDGELNPIETLRGRGYRLALERSDAGGSS